MITHYLVLRLRNQTCTLSSVMPVLSANSSFVFCKSVVFISHINRSNHVTLNPTSTYVMHMQCIKSTNSPCQEIDFVETLSPNGQFAPGRAERRRSCAVGMTTHRHRPLPLQHLHVTHLRLQHPLAGSCPRGPSIPCCRCSWAY